MLGNTSAFQNEAFVNGEEPTLAAKTDDLVLLNTFLINSKRHRVCYQTLTGRLVWEQETGHKGSDTDQKTKGAAPKTVTVPLCDILCVKLHDSGDDSSPNQAKKWYVKVVYAKRKYDKKPTDKWCVTSAEMFNKDRRILRLWFKVLDAAIKDKKTPKSLIVFVNPFGGEKKAMQVYERIAKPLFELAGIEVNCVVSQRARQITDLIMSMRLDIYDGICCVGGDGTFSEVFNGLLQRESQDGSLAKPSLPIGIIPAGSTDTVAFCLHNTSDIQTCVLAIVLGSTRGLDLASVAGQDGMRKFYASMFSFGFLGDVAWDSENYRYLGKKRYDFSGFKIFLKNRGYSANVAILLDKDANNASYRERCLENCQHCVKASKYEAESEEALDDTKQWKTINGKFFMINVANISCACHRSKNGVAHAHLADGFLDITLVRHTGFWNNLRLLVALKAGEADRLPFVENFRARRFHFRKIGDEQGAKLNSADGSFSGDNSLANSTQQFDGHHFGNEVDDRQQALWNCDGEKVDCADCVVRSHLQLVRVFRRGGGCGGNNAAQTIAL